MTVALLATIAEFLTQIGHSSLLSADGRSEREAGKIHGGLMIA